MVNTVVNSIPYFPYNQFERISFAGEGGSKVVWCVKDLASQSFKALARYRLPADFERDEDENEEDWKASVIEGEKIVQEKASTEIKILSLIKGLKHVISLEGITFEGSRPCFLMPYYERGNLQQAINKDNLTTEQKYQIALDLLHGLKQCQIKKKIFIGDIKPDNVLLNEKLRAILIDFETALITNDDDDFRKDTYNLFYCIFAFLFNEKDGKYYAYVQKLLSTYDCHSFPSITTAIMLWKDIDSQLLTSQST